MQRIDGEEPAPEPELLTEWGGTTPYLDWDPAQALTAAGDGSVVTSQPDRSGNGRVALNPLAVNGYPFLDLLPPTWTAADTRLNNKPSLVFRGNPNLEVNGPAFLTPVMPSGPLSVALVLYSDMPDHAAMPGAPTAPPPSVYTNNYAISSQSDNVGIYADGGNLRGFRGWLDPAFGEPGGSADFATTSQVLLFTASGESSPGAMDSTVRYFANSLTALTLTNRASVAAVKWLLGCYQGGAGYLLQGGVGRFIVWDTDKFAQSNTIIPALGTLYGTNPTP